MLSSSDQKADAAEAEVSDGMPRLSRLNLTLICLSIVSMCAALYMSPIAAGTRKQVTSGVSAALDKAGVADLGAGAASPSATPSAKPTTKAAVAARAATVSASPTSSASTSATASATPTHTAAHASIVKSNTAKKISCSSFTYQQDAQAVYVQNLSDPYGLDGKVGPYDGDGLACSALPDDPSRAASTPVGAYVPPTPSAAAKAALVNPSQDYFGYSQNGLPGDSAMFTSLAKQAGKAPSSVGWFQNFDTAYRGDLVTKAWKAGALPVITLMPTGADSTKSYSLTSILNGSWDSYLTRYAGDVVRTNLPVTIRFAHEMNSTSYPWAAGMTSYNNTPAKYVAAWRHVWSIFQSVGANDDVIWLWSPSRVDNLVPSSTNGISSIADDYPGDAYVDWVGASVYLRRASVGASYAASFGQTVNQLEALTDKPIFFAETAAIQTDNGADQTALKAAWTANVLSTFAADSRIVGFLWFNNVATAEGVTNDWRVSSSADALAAFSAGVAAEAFAAGVDPDS
ncbi:hypothetical protein D9V37_08060 [Nocardioides mangrovicus]|uniref:GH26 domain-containing protein n=1 Tax=Nocardioides mangrovicus TaxID=2478913 RepID=A0A3L8P455_9ACTN|nr:glycosyl hydrolase [Nocardioides mangrovicus]RLV49832.1 hypothetical protein D9V37_08060 [Nocardioides mangrovicus]